MEFKAYEKQGQFYYLDEDGDEHGPYVTLEESKAAAYNHAVACENSYNLGMIDDLEIEEHDNR